MKRWAEGILIPQFRWDVQSQDNLHGSDVRSIMSLFSVSSHAGNPPLKKKKKKSKHVYRYKTGKKSCFPLVQLVHKSQIKEKKNSDTPPQKKKKEEEEKASFCTAVRQMLISY